MMPKTGPFLFVSHVREDHAATMEIVAELERLGLPCWVAPRDVGPGKPFDDEIAEALENCQAMLLIFSDRCNENMYIRREVTVAGEIGKHIIPFRIEDVQPRRALRIRLSDLNWIDAFVSREQAINQVARIFAPANDEATPKLPVRERAPAERRVENGAPTVAHDKPGPDSMGPGVKPPEPPEIRSPALERISAGQGLAGLHDVIGIRPGKWQRTALPGRNRRTFLILGAVVGLGLLVFAVLIGNQASSPTHRASQPPLSDLFPPITQSPTQRSSQPPLTDLVPPTTRKTPQTPRSPPTAFDEPLSK
jgi:TIR domain